MPWGIKSSFSHVITEARHLRIAADFTLSHPQRQANILAFSFASQVIIQHHLILSTFIALLPGLGHQKLCLHYCEYLLHGHTLVPLVHSLHSNQADHSEVGT